MKDIERLARLEHKAFRDDMKKQNRNVPDWEDLPEASKNVYRRRATRDV